MNRSLQLAAAAASLALGSSASAQVRGMTSVWSVAFSVDAPSTPQGPADPMQLKLPRSRVNNAPGAWAYQTNIGSPAPVIPDYTALAMFGVDEGIIEVDGHSAGGDMVPIFDAQGAPRVDPVFDNWLVFVMSVKNGAVGAPGSYLASVAGSRPVGSELLGYYALGSQNIDASLPGSATVEHTALSFGYTAANTPELDALDYNISLNTVAPANLPPNVLFNNTNEYYFTITPNTVEQWELQRGPATPFAQNRLPRPGDIYRIIWDENNNIWGPRQVYRTDTDLGLMEGEDVDALSVSRMTGVTCFSTPLNDGTVETMYPNRRQLLISSGNGSFLELTDRDPSLPPTATPAPVGDRVGLDGEVDDIDGLCGIDPEGGERYDTCAGTPIASVGASMHPALAPIAGDPQMSISLQRGVIATGGPNNLSVQVAGWGAAQEIASEVVLVLYTGQEPLVPNEDQFLGYTHPVLGDFVPGWTALPAMPRAAGQDLWEYSLEFDIPMVGQHLAIGAILVQNGQFVAGSVITQAAW